MRKIAYTIIVLTIFLFILEIIFRLYLVFNHPNPHREEDNLLGWKNKENFTHIFNSEGIGKVNFSTQKYGFRIWGDVNTKKKKILFVGDSYTAAKQISDGKCYYNYLDTTKYEVFAFGCDGYGTLQEFIFIEPLLKEINPDLIVWQFCHNDLINNSLELDKLSYINNMLLKKPYLINGEIEHRYPQKKDFIGVIDNYSTLALWAHYKTNYWLWAKYGSIEENFNLENEKFRQSYLTTKELYSRIKKLGYPTIVFSTTTSFGYSEIQRICSEIRLPFISSVNTILDSLVENGIKIDFHPYDWHWNEKGHEEAGLILNNEIESYLKK